MARLRTRTNHSGRPGPDEEKLLDRWPRGIRASGRIKRQFLRRALAFVFHVIPRRRLEQLAHHPSSIHQRHGPILAVVKERMRVEAESMENGGRKVLG